MAGWVLLNSCPATGWLARSGRRFSKHTWKTHIGNPTDLYAISRGFLLGGQLRSDVFRNREYGVDRAYSTVHYLGSHQMDWDGPGSELHFWKGPKDKSKWTFWTEKKTQFPAHVVIELFQTAVCWTNFHCRDIWYLFRLDLDIVTNWLPYPSFLALDHWSYAVSAKHRHGSKSQYDGLQLELIALYPAQNLKAAQPLSLWYSIFMVLVQNGIQQEFCRRFLENSRYGRFFSIVQSDGTKLSFTGTGNAANAARLNLRRWMICGGTLDIELSVSHRSLEGLLRNVHEWWFYELLYGL